MGFHSGNWGNSIICYLCLFHYKWSSRASWCTVTWRAHLVPPNQVILQECDFFLVCCSKWKDSYCCPLQCDSVQPWTSCSAFHSRHSQSVVEEFISVIVCFIWGVQKAILHSCQSLSCQVPLLEVYSYPDQYASTLNKCFKSWFSGKRKRKGFPLKTLGSAAGNLQRFTWSTRDWATCVRLALTASMPWCSPMTGFLWCSMGVSPSAVIFGVKVSAIWFRGSMTGSDHSPPSHGDLTVNYWWVLLLFSGISALNVPIFPCWLRVFEWRKLIFQKNCKMFEFS